jgi:sortase B
MLLLSEHLTEIREQDSLDNVRALRDAQTAPTDIETHTPLSALTPQPTDTYVPPDHTTVPSATATAAASPRNDMPPATEPTPMPPYQDEEISVFSISTSSETPGTILSSPAETVMNPYVNEANYTPQPLISIALAPSTEPPVMETDPPLTLYTGSAMYTEPAGVSTASFSATPAAKTNPPIPTSTPSPEVTPQPARTLNPSNPAAIAAALNSGKPMAASLLVTPTPAPILPQYQSLHESNPDMIGWVWVEGTKIDFPVMQTGEDDPEYYLTHDFMHNESRNGVPFLDVRCDLNVRNTNWLVYGHNINNREMFGLLRDYADRSFWRRHPTFHFDFINREAEYEVVACFRGLRPKNEKIRVDFKYYEYLDLSALEAFDEFFERVRKVSIYNTGVTPVWGDEIVMLSTCSYHVEEAGTLVVVGRRVR